MESFLLCINRFFS